MVAEVTDFAEAGPRPLREAHPPARDDLLRLAAHYEGRAVFGGAGKRLYDTTAAALALAALAPILAGAAFALWWSSRAIFESEPHLGLRGRPFQRWSLRGGDRPPWLERLGLARALQLVNVLRGEMSLVGPPPRTPAEVAAFLAAGAAAEHCLLQARPGLVSCSAVLAARAGSAPWEMSRALRAERLWLRRPWRLRRDLALLAAAFAPRAPRS